MRSTILSISLLLFIFTWNGCKKDQPNPDDNGDDNKYKIPSTYNFQNTSYPGQTVRLLLLRDLEEKIESIEKGKNVTAAELKAIFENSNSLHSGIATGKNLKDKFLASSYNQGKRQEKLDSLYAWFDQLEQLSSKGDSYIRADGVDLSQMVPKTIMGYVFYDQAINKYLESVNSDLNKDPQKGRGTDMEHHFDEAFGYFGAARDYNTYSDAEIKSSGEKDSDGNGKIDPESEQCFYYARTAAKRDVGTSSLSGDDQTDYTKTLFDAWLNGRASISNKDYATRDKAITTIRKNWDNIIAATVIHYLNEVIDEINNGKDISEHWAEAKGYSSMIPVSQYKKLSDGDINMLNTYLGQVPGDAKVDNLKKAKDLIRKAYGFSTAQVSNW